MTCIWDTSNKGAHIHVGRNGVSAGNVADVTSWESIIGTVSQSSGKKIVEMYVGNFNQEGANGQCVGFGNASINLNSYVGSDGNSIGLQIHTGWLSPSGGWGNPSHPEGYVIQFAIDMGAKKIWARTDRNLLWNNDASADPATGTNGLSYSTTGALFPACSLWGSSTNTNDMVMSLNAGGFPFSLSVPSGFSAWDTGVPTVDGTTGGTVPTAWDSGHLGTGFSRGGTGNLTITKNTTDGWTSAIASSLRRGGLAYFEIEFVSSYTNKAVMVGFGDHTIDITSYLGHDKLSIGAYFGADQVYSEGNQVINTWQSESPAAGDVFSICADTNKGLWWIKDVTKGDAHWNGTASADPVAGVYGFQLGCGSFDGAYICVSSDGSSAGGGGAGPDQFILNTTGSFVGTPPTGFSAWDVSTDINAAVSETLADLTGVITVEDAGAYLTETLGTLTGVITGSVPADGVVVETLAPLTLLSSGSVFHAAVLSETLQPLTLQAYGVDGGPFFFAWTDDPVPGTPDNFNFSIHGIDADELGIFSVAIKDDEGQIPTLTIEVRNPRVGLLSSGRQTWAWLSWFNGTTVVPIFRGKLNATPENTQDEVVTLVFIARAVDFDGQKGAVSASLQQPPYWDNIWLTPQALENPDAILASYPRLWNIDRITNVVTTSDFLFGEDGNVTLTADDHFYDAMEIKYTADPKRTITVDGVVTWDQRATGILDFTDLLVKAFNAAGSLYSSPLVATFSNEGFADTFPLPFTPAGGGWETAPDIAIIQANWEPFVPTTGIATLMPGAPVRLINQSSLDQNNSTGWIQPYELIVNFVKPANQDVLAPSTSTPPPLANLNALGRSLIDVIWQPYQATFVQNIYWINMTMSYSANQKRTERVSFTMTSNIQYVASKADDNAVVNAILQPLTVVTTVCLGGMAPWNSGILYRRAVVVDFGGTLYQSLLDFNLNNNPEFSPKWWTLNITTPYGTPGCSTSVPFPYGPEQPLAKADITLTSALVDQPVDADGALPIGGTTDYVPQFTYFKSDRGQQSFQYLLALARSKLIYASRAVEVRFDTTWDIGLGITLRMNVVLDDYRLPGGTCTGKVKEVVLTAKNGEQIAQVTIACAIGYGGSVTANPGVAEYVDGVFDTGAVQVWDGALIDVFAQSLLYQSFDDFQVVDGAVNLFDISPENTIDEIVIRNGPIQQLEAIAAATIPATGLGTSGPLMLAPIGVAVNEPDPVGALKNSPTRVTMTFKPLDGGPYETRFFPIVEPLQIPKMFDLEAPSL